MSEDDQEIISDLYPNDDLNKQALKLFQEILRTKESIRILKVISHFNLVHHDAGHIITLILNYDLDYHVENIAMMYRDIQNIYEYFSKVPPMSINEILGLLINIIKPISALYKQKRTDPKPRSSVDDLETLLKTEIDSVYKNQEKLIKEELDQIALDLAEDIKNFIPKLGELINNVNKIYNGFIHYYFTFINPSNTYYLLFKHNIIPSPETFELASTTSASDDIFNIDIVKQSLSRNIKIGIYKLRSNKILNRFGWGRHSLLTALHENGIFDYTEQKYGNYLVYNIPKFIQLGITSEYGPNPENRKRQETRILGGSQFQINGKIYPTFIRWLPKPFLEVLYRQLLAIKPNWDRICKSNITNDVSIRYLAKRLLKIDILGNKDQVCAAVRGIELMKTSSGAEIKEIAPALIMQPGGVQHLKYRLGGDFRTSSSITYSIPEARKVDISTYIGQVDSVCKSQDKSNIDAYNLAVELGLQKFVRQTMDKNDICNVLYRYLQIIAEGRSL